MKSFSQFINESIQEEMPPFTELLLSELDKYGVKWKDLATQRQQKNGTYIIEISLVDAIRLLLESDWIKFETRPRAKARYLNLIESNKNYLERFFNFSQMVQYIDPNNYYLNPRSYMMWLYVYRSGYLVRNYGSYPSSVVNVRWDPSDLDSMQAALSAILRLEVLPAAIERKSGQQMAWRLLMEKVDRVPQRVIEDFVKERGFKRLVIGLEEGDLVPGEKTLIFFKNVDFSQQFFQQIMRDDSIPDNVKRAIEQNPNYFAPDDLLSDWF